MSEKHDKCILIDLSYAELVEEIQTDAIRPVFEAFRENVGRVSSMCRMPPLVMYWGALLGTFQAEEHHKRTGTYYPQLERRLGDAEKDEIDPADQAYIEAEITRRIRETLEHHQSDIPFHTRGEWLHGAENLNVLDNYLSGFIDKALDALLSGAILGTWTAFETLAGDLWEATLNARPRLGFVALDAEPETDDDEQTIERKKKIKHNFPVFLLRKWDYDLRTHMGSLLRSKWDFAKRDKAIEAYGKVFTNDVLIIKRIFKNDNIQWINMLRNTIVHQGGVANADFVAQMSRHPEFSRVKEAERIPLTGATVRTLIDETLGRCKELIRFVDSWLIAHKD